MAGKIPPGERFPAMPAALAAPWRAAHPFDFADTAQRRVYCGPYRPRHARPPRLRVIAGRCLGAVVAVSLVSWAALMVTTVLATAHNFVAGPGF